MTRNDAASQAELAGLLDQILRSPDDMALRLAYADAVEGADQERAELIRLQVLDAQRRGAHWPAERRVGAPGNDVQREQGLVYRRGREWAGDLADWVRSWHYLRGFPEDVSVDAGDFLANATEIYRRAPVRHLNLSEVRPVLRELFGSPHLRQIHSLYLVRQGLGDDEIEVLASSPHLGELEWLDLGANHIGRKGLEALAASDRLPRLGYVGFGGNAVDDPTPRFADEYDADTPVATELQARYGRREWLSAHPRAVWPPYRDAVWKWCDL